MSTNATIPLHGSLGQTGPIRNYFSAYIVIIGKQVHVYCGAGCYSVEPVGFIRIMFRLTRWTTGLNVIVAIRSPGGGLEHRVS